MLSYRLLKITNNISRNKSKEKVWLIWFPSYIVSTLSFILFIYITDQILFKYFITVIFFDLTNINSDLFFYFTQMHSDCFMIWPVNKSEIILDDFLSPFGVHFVIEQWFKQTHCFSYFTNIHSGFSLFDQLIKQALCVS